MQMLEQKGKQAFFIPSSVMQVLQRLADAGFEAYLVGGCVRDHLRGVSPGDYDLTTRATPDEMHRAFAGLPTVDTGARHGTVMVLVDGMPIEVTTYRVDGSYRDNRHPDAVRFTASLEEDLARRDFTMNALALHPQQGIIDCFGGCADIAARCIRAVGEPHRRFSEDALRILRGLRFAATLGFSIEIETATAMKEKAGLLATISAERIRQELTKLLLGTYAPSVLAVYADILSVVLPGWAASLAGEGLPALAQLIGDLPQEPVVRFAALFSSMPVDAADHLMRRLRFDNCTRERVGKLLLHLGDPCTGGAPVLRRFAAGLGGADARLLLTLHRARAAQAADMPRILALDAASALLEQILVDRPCLSLRDLAIDGRDLQAAGYAAGQTLGLALQDAFSAVLDGRVENTKEALLHYCLSKQKTEAN